MFRILSLCAACLGICWLAVAYYLGLPLFDGHAVLMVVALVVLAIVVWLATGPTATATVPEEASGQHGLVLMPEEWDESQIALGIKRYKGNPGMLNTYFEGVLQRFVMGQRHKTVQTRIAFLERFNEYAAVARESYQWQRYLRGGRAEMEEDAEDIKAEVALKQAQLDLDLIELDREAKRQEKLLQIEKIKREIAELNKPSTPLASAPRQSIAESRDLKRRDLKERENRVLEELRMTQSNPILNEEQKRRKLNALEQILGEIHEEQAGLL